MKIPLFVLYKSENESRKELMTPQQIDLIFPFFVFAYGITICVVTSIPTLLERGDSRLPQNMMAQLRSHEPLGWICFVVGGLWSLQNLWVT